MKENPNYWKKQRDRGIIRKYEAIIKKGGRCCRCGYSNNYAALDFHHIDKEDKEFNLDVRAFSNTSIEKLITELSKCILLCSNCHREEHNPDYIKELFEQKVINIKEKYNKITTLNILSGSICPECNQRFPKSKGKIYCSKECNLKSKKYPTYEELQNKYVELKSWEKVATYFNITRRIAQGIRKRHKNTHNV